MKNILVTGGAGFIGSHLVKKLLKLGHHVSVITRPSTDIWRIKNMLSSIKLYRGDITDFKNLKKIIYKINPDGVFHLATSTIMSGATAPDEEVIKTNFGGTLNLMKIMRDFDYDFFVQTGSFLEYGLKEYPLKESDRCEPGEIYSITKLAATLYGQALAKNEKKPIITLRIFTPYGPFVQRGRLVYEVIARALRGEKIELSRKFVTRDFIFVEDLVNLLIEVSGKAKKCAGEIFNAGSGKSIRLDEFVKIVLKTTGSKSIIKWNARPLTSYDKNIWQADIKKTYSRFKWRPIYALEDGISETVEWFKKQNL